MRIGFVGLGKIGLPIAVCMAMRGHEVVGHDSDRNRMNKEPKPGLEGGVHGGGHFNDELARSDIKFGTLKEVCDHAEIIFVAVQTPHGLEFEGVTSIAPGHRADFDYAWLRSVVSSLATLVSRETTVAIISTVLPRTCRRELLPLCTEHMHLVYNPSFIAMGTTMFDFFNPEIVLCGADRPEDHAVMRMCYAKIGHGVPFFACSIETAELIKVAYNTFIGQKVIFANMMMEICHRIPEADVDDVSRAMALSTRRVISPAYLRGGMGDGGACHPRDNIAMSWLADDLSLSSDLFGDVMVTRQRQAEWIADLMETHAGRTTDGLLPLLPLAVYGLAYKAESDLDVGSAARLVVEILERRKWPVLTYDPVMGRGAPATKATVILIGTKHLRFRDEKFPVGSAVIDPWRYIPDREGVMVVRLGEQQPGPADRPR